MKREENSSAVCLFPLIPARGRSIQLKLKYLFLMLASVVLRCVRCWKRRPLRAAAGSSPEPHRGQRRAPPELGKQSSSSEVRAPYRWRKERMWSRFVCWFDVMHDLGAPPCRAVGGKVVAVIFPRWFGGTLSDARVAPGMKWKETPGSLRTGPALRCKAAVFGRRDEVTSRHVSAGLTGRREKFMRLDGRK